MILRQIKAEAIEVTPNAIGEDLPEFEWIRPQDLWVEAGYQRDPSANSMRMIKRIVAGWDWARMKPPICARDTKGRMYVMDGQHTAIAAASHPGIEKIPVMVVKAESMKHRAQSFLSHNRDRLGVTPAQIYYAAIAAGDELALHVKEACERAGVTILRVPPANAEFKEGETMAVSTLKRIVELKGPNGGNRVLRILRNAGRLPIQAHEMKGVAYFLWTLSKTSGTKIPDEELSEIIASKDARKWWALARRMREQNKSIIVPAALAQLWLTTYKTIDRKAA